MSDPSPSPGAANDQLNLLVVVAHPHDFTHCAATCGIHRRRGEHVTVVCLTDGAIVHNEVLYDEMQKPAD